MQRSKYDIWVGLFVMLGFASIVFLALKVGNLVNLSFERTYTFDAQFSNIGGVSSGSPVKSAGVVVGRVRGISLSNVSHQAIASIELESRYEFPVDSSLNIMTAGLLGEEYIAIYPGTSSMTIEQEVRESSEPVLITRTQPSVSIGEVIAEIMPGSDGNRPLVGNTYMIDARFTNLGSVKVGSSVKSAGVVVGRVRDVAINPDTFEAVVTLELESKYSFPDDSSLRIMSSGLIGGQYIDISPGFGEETFEEASAQTRGENGGNYTVTNTQSALILEDLIGNFLFSMAQSSGGKNEK